NIRAFSFRFMPEAAADIAAADQALLDAVTMTVGRAEGGLLANDDGFGTSDWRLIADADGRFRVFTDDANFLPVGSFGNLLKITFANLTDYVDSFGGGARQPEFFLGMRMDNEPYFSPQSEGQPSSTKFFLYPGGIANDGRALSVAMGEGDLAAPAQFVEFLSEVPGFDPENADALDTDSDSIPNFNDPVPMDDELPASRVVPNPVDVNGDEDTFTLTIRNNLLDSFTWSIDTDNLPAWIPAAGILYGENAESATQILTTLAPGETETLQFSVDRSGLTPGTTVTEAIDFNITNSEYAFILPESVFVTVEINP
ncbi:MAG: hypothetical protein L3K26_19315, partial [Candidatus Hydrogenedentes bacterium]|nr:hypothetical protein [Candidatus Hydrogenedentota bacterium]